MSDQPQRPSSTTFVPLRNVGTKTRTIVVPAKHPDTDAIAQQYAERQAEPTRLDVLLVNPPTPDGAIWIRSQHRVGRRSRENMIWPQVSLAQMAALLGPTYTVRVVDAVAERMDWPTFERIIRAERPRYYVTQLTAPTLQNDLYGTFLAKGVGAVTMAFGTHITPMPRETLRPYPSLDYGLRGEPDLTLRDLIDRLEGRQFDRPDFIRTLFEKHDAAYRPAPLADGADGRPDVSDIKGLVWRRGQEIVVNPDRPFIADLDDLPVPRYDLLPLKKYLMPLIKGPFCFIVTSRGCPAGCTYCIKHVSYGPDDAPALAGAAHGGDHAAALARREARPHVRRPVHGEPRPGRGAVQCAHRREPRSITWTCNSRVDFVDEEMLQLMAKAGCFYIAWGLESGNKEILSHARKGVDPERARQSLKWAREAGIKNWGYFIIGLPGETEGHHQADDRLREGACRSTSRSSTSPRPIRARRSSTRW